MYSRKGQIFSVCHRRGDVPEEDNCLSLDENPLTCYRVWYIRKGE